MCNIIMHYNGNTHVYCLTCGKYTTRSKNMMPQLSSPSIIFTNYVFNIHRCIAIANIEDIAGLTLTSFS